MPDPESSPPNPDPDPALVDESGSGLFSEVGSGSGPKSVRIRNTGVKAGLLEVQSSFFSGRVINGWNQIPFEVRNKRTAARFMAAHRKIRESVYPS